MPRKYIIVSSSSSGTSLDSFEYSLDSDSIDRRRHPRSRMRRASPRPEQPESLHWWLARWLSSEFAKIASAVYEGGKGCIRYLSSTALQALPSAETDREIQEELSGTRRSRGRHRNRNRSLYPVPGESLGVRKSRRSHRKSVYGRRDSHSSPYDTTYVSLKNTRPEHGRKKSQYPVPKQGSRRSHHRERFGDDWIHEKNWIENLLKEVKSNFKNPVKVKLYKVSPGEGPSRSEHSTGSDASVPSKFSISIEELVSPAYPSGPSELFSSSGGCKSSETTAHQSDVSVAKTRGPSNKAESSKRRPNEPDQSEKPGRGALEKLRTPTMLQQDSPLRLSVADFHELSASVSGQSKTDAADFPKVPYNSVNEQSTSQTVTAVPTAPNQTLDFHNLRHGDVFYPVPGKKCKVLCEDVATTAEDNGMEQQPSDIVYETPGSGGAPKKPNCGCLGFDPNSASLKNSGTPDGQSKQQDTGPAMRAKNPPSIGLFKSDLKNAASSSAATMLQQNGVEKQPCDIVYKTPGKALESPRCGCPGCGADVPEEKLGLKNATLNKDSFCRALRNQNMKNVQHAVTIDSTFTKELGMIEEEQSITVTGSSGTQVFAIPSAIAPSEKVGDEVPQNKVEDRPVAQSCRGSSLASVKRREDDRASLFLVRPPKGEPTSPANVETSGVSLLTKTASGKLPFSLPGQECPEITKTASPRESSKTSLRKGILNKDSNSKISVTSRTKSESSKSALAKSAEKLICSTNTLTQDSVSETVSKSAVSLKSPSKTRVHGIYDKGHLDMFRITSSELNDSPSLDGTSPDAVTAVQTEKSAVVSTSAQGVTQKRNDDDVVIVPDEASSAQYLNASTSIKSKIQSARSIVESVTSSKVTIQSGKSASEIAVSSVPSYSSLGFGSQKELLSTVHSPHSIASKEVSFAVSAGGSPSVKSLQMGSATSTAMNASNSLEMGSPVEGLLDELSNQASPKAEAVPTKLQSNDSFRRAYGLAKRRYGSPQYATSVVAEEPEELLMEMESSSVQNSRSDVGLSTLPGTPPFGDEYVSASTSPIPNGHLTFGQEEKISFTISAMSDTFSYHEPQVERFKVPGRPSTTTQKLPPIEEEEPSNDSGGHSPTNSILQQRRHSIVAPGLLKRKSHTIPTVAEVSNVSCASSGISITERCPCKKICSCCTCGIAGHSVAPSLTGGASKNDPSAVGVQVKSASKPHSQVGAIDMSSEPTPKNSFDVLRSPFYAHWDYYDLDQDHPIARFVRRPEHAEFDPTDTILMKNVRVGGYLIPYLKVSTKEMVTSKMVCNFYKTRKLPIQGKGASRRPDSMDGTNLDFERSSSSKELAGEEKKKCRCKETTPEEEENIWNDYFKEQPDMLDFPTDLFLEDKSKCSQNEEGCMCIDRPDQLRKIPVPGTPCESCDCFISDFELRSAPVRVRTSGMTTNTSSESSIDKTAVVDEYICTLQELCSNLCSMIGKIKVVIDETSLSVHHPSPEPDK